MTMMIMKLIKLSAVVGKGKEKEERRKKDKKQFYSPRFDAWKLSQRSSFSITASSLVLGSMVSSELIRSTASLNAISIVSSPFSNSPPIYV